MSFKLSPEQKELYDKLTSLQKYTAAANIQGYTQEKAYLWACEQLGKTPGNDPRALASQILANPHVGRFLDSILGEREEEVIEDAIMSREEMEARLTAYGRGEFTNLIEIVPRDPEEPNGAMTWRFKRGDEMRRQDLALIKEISSSPQGLKIKLHDSMQGMKQLAELRGYNKPSKVDLSSSDGSMSPRPFNDFYAPDSEPEPGA